MKHDLAKRFLEAVTIQALSGLIEEMKDTAQSGVAVAWKPVGGNDNNLAIINLGSDPAAGVVERITNAVDSVLDLEWMQHKQPPHIMSPRAAVDAWFDIRDGKLSQLTASDVRKLEEISKRVEVTLRDSDRNDRPTVDIRDTGTGILPQDFGDTILSLNKNRKLKKLFLAGAFGQGGSTALAYSDYTVIYSRKHADDGTAHSFAFTVVRFNAGDPNVDKHGVYEHAVDRATGHPFIADISIEDFPAGTLVRHLTMDVGKYSAVMTAPTGSLWFLTHNYLFDPVLPFRIQDARTGKNETARTVTGNYRLLSQGTNTEYQREATRNFKGGCVTLKWWVLSPEGDKAKDRSKQYVLPSKPIIITYNGQKQGDFPNTVIKDDLKLPYLDRYLIVHLDCDRLDAESRRQLFPTTRENIRDTPIGDDLRSLVVETLSEDEELKRLDKERKRRYLSQDDSSTVENIRKRLARRISLHTKGSGGVPANLPTPGHDRIPPAPREPIPVQDPPTFLKIVSKSPRPVYAGRGFSIKFQTDAHADNFQKPDSFLAVITPPTVAHFAGTANIQQGHGIAYFKTLPDVAIDSRASLTLELRPPRSTALSDKVEIEVVAQPNVGGGNKGDAPSPNINPRWVQDGDQFWIDNDWNTGHVAKVTREEDSIDIYVSAGNENLAKLLARAQRQGTAAVDTIKNHYLEHISFYALLHDIDRLAKKIPVESLEDQGAIEEIAYRHACETVCGMIESVFEVLTAGAELSKTE
jgi:hypothetical protein